jgi:hypothetical protein
MSQRIPLLTRRRILRGVLDGAAVAVALPFLECYLNGNGTALANGAPIPVRFGTWFWGLGMDSVAFIPKKVGADYDLPPQIQSWEPVRKHINLFTNFRVPTDGKPNLCHHTGWVALRTGVVPVSRTSLGNESVDVTIGDGIGGTTRFRQLDCAASGNPRDTYSFRSADAQNPVEISPMEFYRKVFGLEFQDPNSPNFTPNPAIIVRKSVLSAVSEQTAALQKQLGASDRQRLDEYLTSVRQLEDRLALQLQKPPSAPSCKVPPPVTKDPPLGVDVDVVAERHRLMATMMAMAVACNQTRIFNMTYSNSFSYVVKKGLDKTHHTVTHEEAVDQKLGYQPTSNYFVTRALEEFAYFVGAFASIPEGDGTLLDNVLIYAHSDQEFAKIHSINGIPMMTAGKAGGQLKTGIHVDGNGEAGTQLGFTVQKVMGLNVSEWGTGSLKTSRVISEILV